MRLRGQFPSNRDDVPAFARRMLTLDHQTGGFQHRVNGGAADTRLALREDLARFVGAVAF